MSCRSVALLVPLLACTTRSRIDCSVVVEVDSACSSRVRLVLALCPLLTYCWYCELVLLSCNNCTVATGLSAGVLTLLPLASWFCVLDRAASSCKMPLTAD